MSVEFWQAVNLACGSACLTIAVVCSFGSASPGAKAVSVGANLAAAAVNFGIFAWRRR